jgi:hypothetical protein
MSDLDFIEIGTKAPAKSTAFFESGLGSGRAENSKGRGGHFCDPRGVRFGLR